MQRDEINATDAIGASVTRGAGALDLLNPKGRFEVECIGADGKVKWRDHIDNLVITVGKNLMLDTILAGSAFTATVVMGLKGTGSAVAGDTQASHSGWSEIGGANAPAYTGDRKTPSFSAASSGSKSTSSAVSFSITSPGTVAGIFININGSATKDNSTGTLFAAGDFSTGNKSVSPTDVLNATYSISV